MSIDNHASMMPSMPENFTPASAEALADVNDQAKQLWTSAEVLGGTTINDLTITYDGVCASFEATDPRVKQIRDKLSIYPDLDGDLTIVTSKQRPTMEDDGPVSSATRTARTYPLNPAKQTSYAQEIGRPNQDGNLKEIFTSTEEKRTPLSEEHTAMLSAELKALREAVMPKASRPSHRTWFSLGSLLRRRLTR